MMATSLSQLLPNFNELMKIWSMYIVTVEEDGLSCVERR